MEKEVKKDWRMECLSRLDNEDVRMFLDDYKSFLNSEGVPSKAKRCMAALLAIHDNTKARDTGVIIMDLNTVRRMAGMRLDVLRRNLEWLGKMGLVSFETGTKRSAGVSGKGSRFKVNFEALQNFDCDAVPEERSCNVIYYNKIKSNLTEGILSEGNLLKNNLTEGILSEDIQIENNLSEGNLLKNNLTEDKKFYKKEIEENSENISSGISQKNNKENTEDIAEGNHTSENFLHFDCLEDLEKFYNDTRGNFDLSSLDDFSLKLYMKYKGLTPCKEKTLDNGSKQRETKEAQALMTPAVDNKKCKPYPDAPSTAIVVEEPCFAIPAKY